MFGSFDMPEESNSGRVSDSFGFGERTIYFELGDLILRIDDEIYYDTHFKLHYLKIYSPKHKKVGYILKNRVKYGINEN